MLNDFSQRPKQFPIQPKPGMLVLHLNSVTLSWPVFTKKIIFSEAPSTKHLNTELFEVRISNGLVFQMVHLWVMSYVLD